MGEDDNKGPVTSQWDISDAEHVRIASIFERALF